MPGWHDATQQERARGEIRMVGIVQEQHPDRSRLFMQWKAMGWPVLVDSYDLLEVPYVPITLALDEHGVVREIHPPLGAAGLSEDFLAADFPAPGGGDAEPASRPDLETLGRRARSAGDDARAWRGWADALAVWGGHERLDATIDAYRRAVELAPGDRWAHFRLGVALRKRFDSSDRREGDFQAAVDHWSRALELDPNQYIFRRRLQQYGPRLDKPYPFYDWVPKAREAIRARGEEPVALTVEPRGSEFARPARAFRADTAASQEAELDPEGVIHRDDGYYVEAEATVVPAAVEPGGSARVHLRFRPNAANDAHWNNEVDDLKLWVQPPAGWAADRRLHVVARPDEVVSDEVRRVELELRAPEAAGPGTAEVPAYALYYVCEGVRGICVYRRKDLTLRVPIRRE